MTTTTTPPTRKTRGVARGRVFGPRRPHWGPGSRWDNQWRKRSTKVVAITTATIVGAGLTGAGLTISNHNTVLDQARTHLTAVTLTATTLSKEAVEGAAAVAPLDLTEPRDAIATTTARLTTTVKTVDTTSRNLDTLEQHTARVTAAMKPVQNALTGLKTAITTVVEQAPGKAPLVPAEEFAALTTAHKNVTAAFESPKNLGKTITALVSVHERLMARHAELEHADDERIAAETKAAEEHLAQQAAQEAAAAAGGSTATPGKGTPAVPGKSGTTTKPAPKPGAPGSTSGGAVGGTPGGNAAPPPAAKPPVAKPPYTDADAWAAVVANSGARPARGECLVINWGTWGRGSHPPPPALQFIGEGGWLGAKAHSTGDGGSVTYYACY